MISNIFIFHISKKKLTSYIKGTWLFYIFLVVR